MNKENPWEKFNQTDLLYRIITRIRQSLDLPEILSCTVQEMRSFLDTDRVKIYRFYPDNSGEVIAESIKENRLPSLLNLRFPAGDIPPHAREMFVKARLRSIVDVAQQRIILSRSECVNTTGNLTVEEVRQAIEDIVERPVDPCHVEYLTAMGVQSSLVVPILYQQSLWGLLVSHHSESREILEEDLKIVQLIAEHLSIAIAQSNVLTQQSEKARREALINQISTLLHSPLKITEILQIVIQQIITAVKGCGGRLYLCSNSHEQAQIYTYGTQPDVSAQPALLEDYPFWQQLLCSATGELLDSTSGMTLNSTCLQVITDIYQQEQLLDVAPSFHSTNIRSLLVMPLQYNKECLGCLTIFREQIDTDIIWAGRFDLDERNNIVRNSFEAWRELKLAQAQEWTPEEVELILAVGTHLTLAVMQHRLYEREHEQRILVEMRNQELFAARTVAEEASRLKSDFLSSTSHELRTPLASTLNYLKLLKEGFYDNEEELQTYINVAYKSAEHLVSIINDVLDLAKIEAGRMNVHLEQIPLLPLLEDQRNLFSLDSRNKGITLIIECKLDSIYADKIKLKQILTNLLYNAFKFTEKGEIRVRAMHSVQDLTASERQMVEISVIDTGIGIDLSQRHLLFEPFVQAEGTIKRRYGGTGLGLTICKRLVELMGGKIWLDSPGLGLGTTVTFTLPYTNM